MTWCAKRARRCAAWAHDSTPLPREEVDPGLGNGGLGRLAACFLDSLATQQYAAVAYGIRYDYGIFTQVIDEHGAQREWRAAGCGCAIPGSRRAAHLRYTVRFGGRSVPAGSGAGADEPHRARRWVDTSDIHAIAFDQLVPGNRCATVNHLRLWSGRALTPFKIDAFNTGDYAAAVHDQIEAKNLSRVLYPDDSTPQGRELRFRQQYFFVSASLQDLLANHLGERRALESLHEAVAVQLNDTHPTLAIPELMRLLVDEHGMPWADAWRITCAVFSYTNHTLLPEALETWPVAMFERLLPRHLEIIYLINRDFLATVAAAYPATSPASVTCRSSPSAITARCAWRIWR
jgi:glycogen phosphorylase